MYGVSAWVLKLSSEGTIEWQNTYGGSGNDYAHFIQQTTDGGYIVAGRNASFNGGGHDVWILKLNSDGTIAWEKEYGGSGRDLANCVQQTADGGYIVAGSLDIALAVYHPWILKLDSDGNVEWQKTYSGGGNEEGDAEYVRQTEDGGYIASGRYFTLGSDDSHAYILKLNSDGNVEWQKTYSGTEWEGAYSVQQATDGGYIVAGGTSSFGAGSWDAWVLKLNASGEIPNCSAMADKDPIVTDTTIIGMDTSASVYTLSVNPASAGLLPLDTTTETHLVCGVPAPLADFSANKTSGEKPLEVTFTDASTGSIDTWEWDFDNNGTIDSYDQSPAPWTYTVAGDYTVSLTVSGLGGSDTETKTDYIHVSEPSAAPIIDKIRGTKEPGKVIRIIGSGFDEPQGDSEVHIGPKVYGPNHTKIRLWTDTMIKVKLPNYKCAWFKGNDYRRRKIRVVVKSSPQDEGISSNVKSIKVFKPSTCP
jgi:PKD repeat protein